MTNRTADAVYNFSDLQRVKMRNNQLESFRNTWNMVLTGMKKIPDADVLELLYFERIDRHPGISEDIAHYNRLDEDSGGGRSYQFLF